MHYHVIIIAYDKQDSNQFQGSLDLDLMLSGDVKPKDLENEAVKLAKEYAPKKKGYYVRTIVQHDGHEK